MCRLPRAIHTGEKKEVSCIILAAGTGSRFGSEKQLLIWRGKPLWKHTYNKCRAVCSDCHVVGIDYEGGNTRQESVYIGLQQVLHQRVVILDAARPGVTSEQIQTIANLDYPSCSFYDDPIDTVIVDDKVYIPRTHMKLLQVPQAFDTKLLLEAHSKAKQTSNTDDTILMQLEHQIDPLLIKGGKNLMKITYPKDIEILEILCAQ